MLPRLVLLSAFHQLLQSIREYLDVLQKHYFQHHLQQQHDMIQQVANYLLRVPFLSLSFVNYLFVINVILFSSDPWRRPRF